MAGYRLYSFAYERGPVAGPVNTITKLPSSIKAREVVE
jgi:hypothetical protein